MLAFIPVGILFAAALGILIMQQIRPSAGYSWLIANLAAMIAFGVMVYLRWRLPFQVAVANWLPFTQFTDSPIFGLDGASWPYALCLCAVMLSVMLTASARLRYQIFPWAWAGALLVAATGLLALYAANFLTLAMAWTALDLIDLVILSAYIPNRSLGVQTVITFALRVAGTLLVILAALINRSQDLAPTFTGLPALSALFLLLAAGLRLGVLPLNLSTLPDTRHRRGLGTVLHLSAAASSLVVLARLPAQSFSPDLQAWLTAIASLAVLYAAGMWLSATDEIAARPFWLVALAGMAVISAVHGEPQASMAWGVALLLSGCMIFLYSARMRGLIAFPLLGLLGMSALPFTPAAGGWQGLLGAPFSLWQVVVLFAHILLLLGYLRFMVRSGDKLHDMERWVQVVYPLGLLILVFAQWLVGTIGWREVLTMGTWWAALLTGLGLALGGGLSLLLRRFELSGSVPVQWYLLAARRIGGFLARLLSLRWLYDLLWAVYNHVEQLVQFLTGILEGDGGVLWVFVLLALFVSVLTSQISP